MQNRETSSEIDDAAAAWAARVDRAPLSPEDEARLAAWIAGDPRRLGAYAKARAVLVRTDRAGALGPDFNPDAFVPADTAAMRSDTDIVPAAVTRRRLLGVGGAAVAASLLAAVGVGTVLLRNRAALATERGEIRRVPLEDGSIVTLNTATRLALSFDAAQREVQLIEGEALFEVAHQPGRPFFVQAGDMRVRAIGTAFSVRRMADERVKVLVSEGQVEVMRASSRTDAADAGPRPVASPPRPVRVSANMQALASPQVAAIATAPVAPDELERDLAWREGRIAFNGVTLAEAAAEFARYSDTRILIDDPVLARRTVTGLFAANNPLGFARALVLGMDLEAETGDGFVRLRPRAS